MALTNVRIPVEVSFITFHDDDLPITSVVEYKKDAARRGSANPTAAAAGGNSAENTFALTTGSFPHEIVVTTCSSFANLRRITLTLDEAKEVVVERCVIVSDAGVGSPSHVSSVDPMSAKYEVIAERQLSRGEVSSSGKAAIAAVEALENNKKDPGSVKYDDLKPRKPQVEVLELDPTGAGKGIRAIKVKIMSGYSDFVGILGIDLYGEESEQRLAVLESKAEVNM